MTSFWKTGSVATLILLGMCYAFPQSGYKEIVVRDGGAISGTVRLAGTRPMGDAGLPMESDFCGKNMSVQRLVVGKGNAVRNAVVYLTKIPQGKRFSTKQHYVLDQKKCEFSPHILIIPGSHALEVVNSDPVLHNVHAYDLEDHMRTLFNVAQPLRGQKTSVNPQLFKNASLVAATCDAGHPWMGAYVFRTEHPYYDLTDANGNFRLEDVPPGTYTLTMWHEGVTVRKIFKEGEKATRFTFEEPYIQTQEVKVLPHGKTQADFQLSLR